MSTEIKPRQVWAWRARQGDPFTIDSLNGDMAEYHYGKRVTHSTYSAPVSLIQRTADLVTDATPAPLDPSKVRKQVHWATDLKRGDVIVSVEAHNAVTVEREEPAPEPEPEWPMGTVAEATVADHPGHRVMRIGQDPDAPTGLVWADALGHRMAESIVTDVRPLVVIDPAAARESIVKALSDLPGLTTWSQGGALTVRSCRLVVDAVTRALGIEAAR